MSGNVFPNRPGDLAATLSDEGITIDGMKVLFDEKVALYPVTLKRSEQAPQSTRPSDEASDAAR